MKANQLSDQIRKLSLGDRQVKAKRPGMPMNKTKNVAQIIPSGEKRPKGVVAMHASGASGADE